MRRIALSREIVAEAWLVCELWHSKSLPQIPGKVQRTLFLLGVERFVAFVRVETQQFLGPLTVSGPMRRPSASGGTLLARALPSNLSVVISSFCRLSLRYIHLKALWQCGH